MFTFAVNFGFHQQFDAMGLKGNPVTIILNSKLSIPELFSQL